MRVNTEVDSEVTYCCYKKNGLGMKDSIPLIFKIDASILSVSTLIMVYIVFKSRMAPIGREIDLESYTYQVYLMYNICLSCILIYMICDMIHKSKEVSYSNLIFISNYYVLRRVYMVGYWILLVGSIGYSFVEQSPQYHEPSDSEGLWVLGFLAYNIAKCIYGILLCSMIGLNTHNIHNLMMSYSARMPYISMDKRITEENL